MKKLLVFLTIVVVFMGLLVFSILVEDKTSASSQITATDAAPTKIGITTSAE